LIGYSLAAAGVAFVLPFSAHAADPANPKAGDGVALPVADYGVASWETKGHGNHRAVLEVKEAAAVVKAQIPWRRRDANPEQKAVLLFNEKGERVYNLEIVSLTGDQCKLRFEASAPGR
jgi:hypothetical protein